MDHYVDDLVDLCGQVEVEAASIPRGCFHLLLLRSI